MGVQDKHRCYFQIGGITVCLESDLDFDTIRFKPEFASFAVERPGDDKVTLRHFFEWPPDLKGLDLGEELYHKAPWSISRKGDTWYYRTLPLDGGDQAWRRFAKFEAHHELGTIISPPSMVERIAKDGWEALSLLTTDQIWLAPVLAERKAVLLHSAAAILNGQGLLFVGHSEAGKSTTVTMLKNAERGVTGPSALEVEILCDDRNIVRKWSKPLSATGPSGWRVHGTWSHGDVAEVSSSSAPLRAILFIQQAPAIKSPRWSTARKSGSASSSRSSVRW